MTSPASFPETLPQRCEVDSEGRVTGPLMVQCNTPWPCRSGTPGGFTSPARGVVLHTEDGYQGGTISWFQDPAHNASATFAVGRGGWVWQFGPAGHGWEAWAQEAGNPDWLSIEDADNTHPSWPFTPAQMRSLALLVEVLSRVNGFPLEEARDPATGRGVALHSEGGAAWGGHLECPGSVRAAQRPAVIAMAKAIRDPPPAPTALPWAADGKTSLAQLAALHGVPDSVIIRLTCEHGGAFTAPVSHWLGAVFAGTLPATAPVPAGTVLYIPAVPAGGSVSG